MNLKTLIAVAVAAAFASPLAVYAGGDKATGASADKSPGASAASGGTAGQGKSDGGAAAMFKDLDKDKDGFVSKEEAAGTPHEQAFTTLDKDSDGKLSPEEHAAAPEHSKKAGAGASAPASASSGGKSPK